MISFSMRKMRFAAIGAAAICCLATAENLPAALPNVVYTASGVFSGVVSGTDTFQLNNQPFSISIYVNEAKFASKYGKQWAQYTGLKMQGSITTGLLPTPVSIGNQTTGIVLAVGNPNADIFILGTGILLQGIQIGISANVAGPKGTLTNDHILPFTAPVTLTPSNATATYTFNGISTTLGLSGTLTGTVMGTAATTASVQLHAAGAQVVTSHADGTQSVRSLNAAPVDPAASADKVMLRLYASGVRDASGVHVQIAGQEVPVLYAGAAGHFPGLDQVIVEVPRSLAGFGKVEVMLTADGQTASPVHIHIQ